MSSGKPGAAHRTRSIIHAPHNLPQLAFGYQQDIAAFRHARDDYTGLGSGFRVRSSEDLLFATNRYAIDIDHKDAETMGRCYVLSLK